MVDLRKIVKVVLIAVLVLGVLWVTEFALSGGILRDTTDSGAGTIFEGGTSHYSENIIEFGSYTMTIRVNGTGVDVPYTAHIYRNITSERSLYKIDSQNRSLIIYKNSDSIYYKNSTRSSDIEISKEPPISNQSTNLLNSIPKSVDYEYLRSGRLRGTEVSIFESKELPNNSDPIIIHDYPNSTYNKYTNNQLSEITVKTYLARGDIVRKATISIRLQNGDTLHETITFSNLGNSKIRTPAWVPNETNKKYIIF